MENKKVSENYTINSQVFVPILIDEASIREEEDSLTFKVLATHKYIGWVSPMDNDDFSIKNLKPFNPNYYIDIIFNSESFTEIAMYLETKDNIHYSLKPYKYKDKYVIFQ